MQLMKQPNDWSCVPTAAMMVISDYIGVKADIITTIGHDGVANKGFHPDEIYVALYKLGFLVTPLDFEPLVINNPYRVLLGLGRAISKSQPDIEEIRYIYDQLKTRVYPFAIQIEPIMDDNNGVILGYTQFNKSHAVAWNHLERQIYDPNGSIYPLAGSNFRMQQFWLIKSYRA